MLRSSWGILWVMYGRVVSELILSAFTVVFQRRGAVCTRAQANEARLLTTSNKQESVMVDTRIFTIYQIVIL